MRNGLRAILAASVSLWVMTAAAQNESQPNDGSKIGEVNFVVSCSLSAQQKFNHAVAILHSFWYEEAESAFTDVIKTDPSCAMGYWGIAMSNWHPLWYPPSAEELSAGSKAAAAAAALGGRTDRERNYIDAISAFYRDSETLDHHTRAVAYEKAMEKVYLRYPDDREAAIFYALALNATASPSDKTYSNQKKAAQILNEIFTEQPDHPGVAHYLIHSYDSAPLAESRAAGCDLLFEDCAVSAACASYALAYLHQAGQMAGFGRREPRIAGRSSRLRTSSLWRGRRLGPVAACHGLSRIRLPAASARPCRKAARRRCQRLPRGDASDAPRRLCNGGHSSALCRGAKGLAAGR